MFGNEKTPRKSGALSVIGADVTIKGDVTTDGDLHLDGTIEGDIACGSIVQGPTSRVTGTIRAGTARLAGAVDGAVQADALVIDKGARVTGDVAYASLTIENGGVIDGRMTHRAGDAEPTLRLVDASA